MLPPLLCQSHENGTRPERIFGEPRPIFSADHMAKAIDSERLACQNRGRCKMSKSYDSQKECERRILEAARCVCRLIPPGDIELSKPGWPDLMIKASAGEVTVEVTELHRLEGENPFAPVQEESFHQEVVRLAEEYRAGLDAQTVSVVAFFLGDAECKRENPEGWRRLTDKKTGPKRDKMARSLAEFVKNHPVPMGGALVFEEREMVGQMGGDTLPAGFEVVSISSTPDRWESAESATTPTLERDQLAAVIGKKNELLPKYRAECRGTPIWLLIYAPVAQGIRMPRSIAEWRFAFDFERVLLYSGVEFQVFEIARG